MILNDDDLVDLLVATFRSMPDLVAALGAAENIFGYKYNYPVQQSIDVAIGDLQAPSLMIAHSETTVANRKDGLIHKFTGFIKARGNVGAVFVALREDVPAGTGGLKFKQATIHEQLHPPFLAGYAAAKLIISEQQSIDFHQVNLILTERGIDT